MNPDHVDFAEWDAAYVLGALSPSDRRDFEEHMESCERCRAAVAEIAPTIGLLARVDRERAVSLAREGDERADAGPDETLRGQVVARVRRASQRRRRAWWLGGLAAAAIIVAVVVVAVNVAVAPVRGTQVFALESVSDAPLSASVELDEVKWGTRIGLTCRYEAADGDAPVDGRPYGLYVIGDDGGIRQVSTWRALPGATARLDAGSDLDVADIAALEIRSLKTEAVLMRVELDSADG